MMQQQDDTLDDLNQAVVRVGHMADTIHEEIGSQNNMLKSLEEDLADAEEQLGVVMGRLAKLLKTKNKCQLGLIVVLTLVVLVLFFLVLYTWEEISVLEEVELMCIVKWFIRLQYVETIIIDMQYLPLLWKRSFNALNGTPQLPVNYSRLSAIVMLVEVTQDLRP